MRQLERWMALRAINDRWMEHLANMDYLREGIGLRGYEQKDPLLIYQKEAFDEFERMQQSIQDDIVRNLFRTQVVAQPQQFESAAGAVRVAAECRARHSAARRPAAPGRRAAHFARRRVPAMEAPRNQLMNVTANREGVEMASVADNELPH